jgi:hypothetical protein
MVHVEDIQMLTQVAKDVIIYENKYKNELLVDIIKRIGDLEEKKLNTLEDEILGVEMTIFLLQQMKQRYLTIGKEIVENIFCSYTECIKPSVLDSLYNEITSLNK